MDIETVKTLYAAGESMRQIARSAGVAQTTIRSRLIQAGVDLRPAVKVVSPSDTRIDNDTAFIALYGRAGVIRGWAAVDANDVHLVQGRRWSVDSGGYAWSNAPSPIRMHQLLAVPGERFDHIDGDGCNNRRRNLRPATSSQNAENKHYGWGQSASRGVARVNSSRRNPWRAYGYKNGRQVHLGHFATEQAAANRAAEWRRSHMPYSQEAL